MIRFKNNVLPVWFQWDGDEESLERAKETIIEDIRLNGLDHYTGFADITDIKDARAIASNVLSVRGTTAGGILYAQQVQVGLLHLVHCP